MTLWSPLGAFLLLASLAAAADAQAPARERQFVYGLNLFDGVHFSGGFAPPGVDTLYLLADHASVVDPKRTEVYFWPLENRYRADFAALNELVPGVLEISRGSRQVATVELTGYVIQLDQASPGSGARLYLGEAARAARARFETERADYLRRLREYTDANEASSRRLAELRARAARGERVTVADPPVPPVPLALFSTELLRGFPLRLPAGEYRIRIRAPGGAIVPDSERRLVAIVPRRHGVGYDVVPQEKWTIPDQANDPASIIYTRPGAVIYLQPYGELEFNALEYARLRDPQDREATPNRWTWVRVLPITGATMLLRRGGQEERRALGDFTVRQLPGAALGYTVVPFEQPPGDPPPGGPGPRQPDLTAFRITAPAGRDRFRLRLIDTEGRELPGSGRDVIVTTTVADWQLALPVLLPLMFGLTVALWRRGQLQRPRRSRM
jgi:hypothetical protein